MCLPADGCYEFTVFDHYQQDGICCFYGDGQVAGFFGGERVISLGHFGSQASQVFGSTCPSRQSTCVAGSEQNFTMAHNVDYQPRETYWNLYSGMELIDSGNHFEHIDFERNGQLVLDQACLPNDRCYHFVIGDAFGDGHCCSRFQNGSTTLYLDGDELFHSDGRHGNGRFVKFSTGPGSDGVDPCDRSCESRNHQVNVTVMTQYNPELNPILFDHFVSKFHVTVSSGSRFYYIDDFFHSPLSRMNNDTVMKDFCLPPSLCYDGVFVNAVNGTCEVTWNDEVVFACNGTIRQEFQFGNCTME
mmetsp:Transcript_26993/g.62721  ORF Transcript_26993/g.62721 Transcript_26993/m.62721 type:complete len:302 (-) Transcript_26993:970-1875(-)